MVIFSKQFLVLPSLVAGLIPGAAAVPTFSRPEHGLHSPSLHHADANHSSYGRIGAIASESAICSDIGRDILLKGGNAADALVGATFCVGVIGMQHSGIGGGGFMLVKGADSTLR